MNDKHGVRDKRGGSWYIVHNSVYDTPMSCEALALYNHIMRYGRINEKLFCEHHKISDKKFQKAYKELKKLPEIDNEKKQTNTTTVHD